MGAIKTAVRQCGSFHEALELEARMRKSLMTGFFMSAALAIAPFALSQIQTVKVTGGR